MDGRLKQSDNHRSAIGKDVSINYKINSTYDVIKTLATILAFITNLADWKPAQSPRQKEQPKMVDFWNKLFVNSFPRQVAIGNLSSKHISISD